MYCSEQPSVFPHIVINDVENKCVFLINDINSLLCAVLLAASCLLSTDKKSEILHDADMIL